MHRKLWKVVVHAVPYGLRAQGVFPFIEHYAGQGVMTEAVRNSLPKGVSAAQLDLRYHRAMDVLQPAGLASGP